MPLKSSYFAKVFKKGMYIKSISSQLRESEIFVRVVKIQVLPVHRYYLEVKSNSHK